MLASMTSLVTQLWLALSVEFLLLVTPDAALMRVWTES